MPSFGLDAREVDQLAAQLVQAGQDVQELGDVNADAADLWLAAVRPPRRSGQLAAAGRTDSTAGAWTIAYPVRYATYVHWGAPRRHIVARPWLVQDEAVLADKVAQLYGDHLTDTVQKL